MAIRALSLAALVAAAPVAAQVGDGNGFLIGTPRGTLSLRGGWALAAARSDVFNFTTEQLTLDRGDFSSPALEADLALRLGRRTDIVFSTAVAGTKKRSEFRKFIDNAGLPIEQRTTFFRVPVTLSVKQYLTDRGRSIGKLAWIPSRVSPYVGVGAGAVWHQLKQVGDFIDFKTMDVFPGYLESKGWSGTAHAMVGGEFSISPRFAIVSEARYAWSKATLNGLFTGFEPIDLSGLSTTAGIAVRF